MFAVPLPWIAAEAGWIVAEFGRQPWIIEGVLPTAVAVSNLGAATLLDHHRWASSLIYTVLFVIEMKLMFKAIRKGPDASMRRPGPPTRRADLTATVHALRCGA